MPVSDFDAADLTARLRLIRSENIGPVTFALLIRRFGSASRALAALPDLAQRRGRGVTRIATADEAARELDAVAAAGGRWLMAGHPDYPPLLSELEGAPPVLAALGDAGLAQKPAVAMVGARNASAAAVRFARQLAAELADAGVVVVSGMARGIDAAAHRGALAGGTIASIAGGLDVVYPPENAALQGEVAERGLLLAESPWGTEPQARHFPRRNRIIAGLAAGTVVIEAAPKSGSLITARIAADAGREVMAVPGSPLDPRAQGCNLLIREGATLVQSAADILDTLGGLPAITPRVVAVAEAAPLPEDVDDATREGVAALLSPTPVAVDELALQTGLPPPVLILVGQLLQHAFRIRRPPKLLGILRLAQLDQGGKRVARRDRIQQGGRCFHLPGRGLHIGTKQPGRGEAGAQVKCQAQQQERELRRVLPLQTCRKPKIRFRHALGRRRHPHGSSGLLQGRFGNGEVGAGLHRRVQRATCFVVLPVARLEAGHHAAQSQVQRAVFHQGEPIQSGRIRLPASLVVDQGGMQREHPTVARTLHERAQRVQRLVGGTRPLLRPGPQQGLQHLRDPLPRQARKLGLGSAPVAGLHIRICQHQERGRAGRQLARQFQRLGPAGKHGGRKRLLLQLRVVRVGPQHLEEIVGRRW